MSAAPPSGRETAVRLFNTFEPVTTLYRELIPRLAEKGVAVTVYASRAEYRAGRDLDAFVAGLPNVRIRRLANLGLHARHGTAAKGAIGVLYFLHACARTLFEPGTRRNVFLTQPPFIPALGLILKRLRGQPYCVILMDLQPQLAAAVGVMRRGSPAYRILHRVIRGAIRGADRVIVIGRCMAETVLREGVPEDRVRVVPNWADADRIRPVPRAANPLRRRMGWEDRFVAMYAGTLGYAQSMEDLVDAAEGLSPDDGITTAIIGEGVRRRAIEARLADSATGPELHPFLHELFPLSEILSAADVHFVSLHPDVTGLAVPSKTYGILAAGRPYIFQGSERSEIARLAREHDVGIVVPPGDPDAVRAAIRSLAADPDRARAMGARGRALAERAWEAGGAGVAIERLIFRLDGGDERNQGGSGADYASSSLRGLD